MNIYGNYIEECSLPVVTEQEILAEGAGLDLYAKFKEAKKYYREQKFYLEEALNEGDIKEAKKIIKDIIDHLLEIGKEIKAIDDSEFTSKVGIFGIQTYEFLISSIGEMLLGAGTSVVGDVAKNKILKKSAEKLTLRGLAGGAAISAFIAIAGPLYKEITKQIETHQKMQYKINREMQKNHKSQEEAKKAVGSIYKNEILDYLTEVISDLRKLDRGLKE